MELLILALLGVIALTVLAVVAVESITPAAPHPDTPYINWPVPVDPSIVVERRK